MQILERIIQAVFVLFGFGIGVGALYTNEPYPRGFNDCWWLGGLAGAAAGFGIALLTKYIGRSK